MNSDGPFGTSPNIGVGFSDAALLVVSLLGFCMLATTVYGVIVLRVKSKEEVEREEAEKMDYDERLDRADVATLNRAQRRARAKNIMKRQRRIAPTRQQNDEGEGQIPADADGQPLSRKERQRRAKASEREERRLFEDKRRALQREALGVAQREKEERQKEEEGRREEEIMRRVQETRARRDEDFRRWTTFLEDGTDVMSVVEFQELAREQRTVGLDQLADRFRISTGQVGRRLRDLVDSRRLTGLVDMSRGEFVALTPSELAEISTRIVEKGIVGGKDVAEVANLVLA